MMLKRKLPRVHHLIRRWQTLFEPQKDKAGIVLECKKPHEVQALKPCAMARLLHSCNCHGQKGRMVAVRALMVSSTESTLKVSHSFTFERWGNSLMKGWPFESLLFKHLWQLKTRLHMSHGISCWLQCIGCRARGSDMGSVCPLLLMRKVTNNRLNNESNVCAAHVPPTSVYPVCHVHAAHAPTTVPLQNYFLGKPELKSMWIKTKPCK